MSSKLKSRCAFKGCSNMPMKDRMFCAEHTSQYGVGQIVFYKKDSNGFGRTGTIIHSERATTFRERGDKAMKSSSKRKRAAKSSGKRSDPKI
jgi:hypothetical protein